MTQPHEPFNVGEIAVANAWITAPGARMPLGGSQWHLVDVRTTRTFIHPATIIAAVILAAPTCLLSLFLLLFKNTTREGNVRLSVSNGDQAYSTEFPCQSDNHLSQMQSTIMVARQLSAYYSRM